jgi:Bacterial Ig-like domain
MSKPVIAIIAVVAVLVLLPLVVHVLKGEPADTPASAPSDTPREAARDRAADSSAPAGTPQVVSMDPPNGATNVPPSLREISVTFNVPMADGCSWCGGGPTFPGAQDGRQPRWSADKRTCVLPVALAPGARYELGLNSVSYRNFMSQSGIPLTPVGYTFSTGAGR